MIVSIIIPVFNTKYEDLSVSFAIQFFVLLYGMTGNPIYDCHVLLSICI